jgi:HEPN/Toprim N-terminal domain 1
MGSYCSLDFDDLHIHSFKSEVPDFAISLFQESDRRWESGLIKTDPNSELDDDTECVKYVTSRAVMLERLDLLGITADAARRAFEGWRTREIAGTLDWAEEVEKGEKGVDWAKPEREALEALSYGLWRQLVPEALKTRFESWDTPRLPNEDAIHHKMRDLDEGWLFFGTNDPRLNVRALLDACSDIRQVSLDITDLIQGGYLKFGARICDEARAAAIKRPMLEPTIIIGEGSSDILILRSALAVLFPSLRDYFGFFDYEELRVDGGANYVTKFLRAFGGARISSKIVAVFDNDTAGRWEFEVVKSLPLPANIKVVRLPDIDLARNYPSVGPQGAHQVDVNGSATSIELYLGRQNLTRPDGTLTPVRWRTYHDRAHSYQGEIENKGEVVERFKRNLTQIRSSEEAQALLPEMTMVWRTIFEVLTE